MSRGVVITAILGLILVASMAISKYNQPRYKVKYTLLTTIMYGELYTEMVTDTQVFHCDKRDLKNQIIEYAADNSCDFVIDSIRIDNIVEVK